MSDEVGRRGFLKKATVAMGAAIGAAVGVPLVRYLLFPVGRKVVESSAEPVDVGAASTVAAGKAPVLVQITARRVRDAWGAKTNVALGAAWLLRDKEGALKAYSSVCPHLGCAVGFDDKADRFACPCHTSAFGKDGSKITGPAKRGLDPLPVEEKDGRVLVTYKSFRPDIADREEV